MRVVPALVRRRASDRGSPISVLCEETSTKVWRAFGSSVAFGIEVWGLREHLHLDNVQADFLRHAVGLDRRARGQSEMLHYALQVRSGEAQSFQAALRMWRHLDSMDPKRMPHHIHTTEIRRIRLLTPAQITKEAKGKLASLEILTAHTLIRAGSPTFNGFTAYLMPNWHLNFKSKKALRKLGDRWAAKLDAHRLVHRAKTSSDTKFFHRHFARTLKPNHLNGDYNQASLNRLIFGGSCLASHARKEVKKRAQRVCWCCTTTLEEGRMETPEHFLIACPHYSTLRRTLISAVRKAIAPVPEHMAHWMAASPDKKTAILLAPAAAWTGALPLDIAATNSISSAAGTFCAAAHQLRSKHGHFKFLGRRVTRKSDNTRGTVASHDASATPPTVSIANDDGTHETTTAASLGKPESTHSVEKGIWTTNSARDHAPDAREEAAKAQRRRKGPGLPKVFAGGL